MKITIRTAALAASMLLLASQASAQAAANPAAATASSPEALALAHGIVDTAFPPERREEMMDKLMTTVASQMKAGMPATFMGDPGLAKIQ
ncbi:hypothetical protein [Novosphingobium sp. 9U]|uniref:hypothetical protein n=1 Tax=Novosphingobium sp. 9U TaxID=2653158 RepID=UPI0012F096AC|nr:hypothetical protein [Novosphingobium sp. 9U]VWX52117.1 exported hypothetical protein [Novosphingobium sp. 9U]